MEWDKRTDFLIVGSGAGAMTAALVAHDIGAETLIIEKSEFYGGSSAMGGGTIWVPANQHMLKEGINDNVEDGLQYLKAVTGGKVKEERLVAYTRQSVKMVQYLKENSDVVFSPMIHYPDYYPNANCSKHGGRTIEPIPFDGLLLKDEFENMRPPHPQVLVMGRLMMTAAEAHKVSSGSFSGRMLLIWLLLRYLFHFKARLKYKRSTRLTLGNGLISRLRYSLVKRKIPISLNTACCELITENNRVIGVVAESNGKKIRIKANKGVLLAAGGFEKNMEMRKKYQRHPTNSDWSAAHEHNTGDAIRMGQEVGAAVDMMNDSWWNTTAVVPEKEMAWLLVMEKNKPGSIIVNSAGRRFTNEGAPYSDVVNAMYKSHESGVPCIPAYLIFDANYRRKNPCGPVMPSIVQPDSRLDNSLKEKFLKKGETIEKLSEKIGIPADNLKSTIELFNKQCKIGIDKDYGRGESLFDRYYGDDSVKPNPNMGPIIKPPFYAIEVWPGDVGTKGGLLTDEFARVINTEGSVIPGLYATGNCSSSMMGNVCPGAGATIGPAMTFGFIAAHDAI